MMDWIGLCLIVLVLIGGVFVLYRLAFNHGYELGSKTSQGIGGNNRARIATRENLDYGVKSPAALPKCDECGKNPHHPDCPKADEQPKPLRRNWKGFSRIKRELESKETA